MLGQWPFGDWFNTALVVLGLCLLLFIPGLIVVSLIIEAVK